MKNILYILAALPLLLGSCSKDNGTPEPSNTAVHFTTAITKASGTSWGDNDQIGVFMKTAGTALDATNLADNVKYTNSTSGFATDTPIYYPEAGAVDFVAYYPYQTSFTTPYIYKVDVSDQSDPTKIDLLYSNDAISKTSSTPTVPLKFSHKLSKLVLTVVKGNGISDAEISGIGIVIAGMPTTADFALADGTFANRGTVTDIAPKLIGANYEAIVIPQAAGTPGRSIGFTVGGQVFTYVIPAATEFVEGKTYAYTVTVSRTGIAVSVGDVTWTSGGTETGTAALQAAVGDYYYDDGSYSPTLDATKTCVGIVFRTKTASQTGLVVSLDEIKKVWGPTAVTTSATNWDNGAVNMAVIKSLDEDLSDYPAFKWCVDKGEGWYLPAVKELLALYNAYNENKTAFNNKLTSTTVGTALNSNIYWTSVEHGYYTPPHAWHFYFINGSWNYYSKEISVSVRAVLAF